MTCTWFFDGVDYVESPQFPHNCPPGQACPKPPVPTPPPVYAAETTTACGLPPP